MCDCENNVTDEVRFAVMEGTPCDKISVDLLVTYKKPIDCYLKYKLWDNIKSSKAELESAQSQLADMVSRKQADPMDCTGLESLYLIRIIVEKIIQKGMCI